MLTEVQPGFQGEEGLGTQGIGVSTPRAAAVAAATAGLAGDVHMPKGDTFVIGTMSATFPASPTVVVTRGGGVALNMEGAVPRLQSNSAPVQTNTGILTVYSSVAQLLLINARIIRCLIRRN